ncbi:phosphoribosylglycinamide synthetase [Diplogelasinospora grovesii]|uniref:phosphoribosylamine--glycine ligase n=1 Tax=Diplogelasinospora grovesii TaxID=303347 RepID=A0AAN6S6E2_9PEZI|nr:phosphoribosylglycinamide synthetase [Diplogelasinospora grovesii]
MKVLLVGKGGREHALAWKLSTSPSVEHVYVVPGNAGTETLAKTSNITDVAANDYPALVTLSKELSIGLVVAGPDDVACDGIEGYFRDSGIPCFAPSKEAAALEGSKTFAKNFMRRHNIPTASYSSLDNHEHAQAYLDHLFLTRDQRVVVKVDGPAAGKGVVLPTTHNEARQAVCDIMLNGKFGSAGKTVVIEEFLEGDEISVLTFSDGKTSKTLPPGQDHKRIFEGNKGPNTGGMGVYAPVPFVTPEMMEEIDTKIIQPTLAGMRSEGRPFVGMLFTGIMLTPSGPKVLEYNVRFGDPETQTMMMLLADDTDFAELLLACAQGRLHEVPVKVKPGYACNVVVAAGGYPDAYRQGDTVTLGDCPPGIQIFHGGTKREGSLKTAGGRVFSVAAAGTTLEEAVAAAYQGVKSIHFDGMFYRKDIAARALQIGCL